MTLEKIRHDFLVECGDDFVGLWNTAKHIKESFPDWSRDKVQAETLLLLEDLLSNNLIVAGLPNEAEEYVQWELDAAACIKRIEAEWNRLGRDPNLGDIVWFTIRDWQQQK